MSSSFAAEGSGPGGPSLWDAEPSLPPAPSAPSAPEEFLWSKPERLLERDTEDAPQERATARTRAAERRAPSATRSKGRPVKKAARKASKRKRR
jgi:hypothetical protein